jgi:hypothetical protein
MRANIASYVKRNWKKLPKSTFNDDEVVIVREDCNENQGYGNHSYSGIGIDRDGFVVWCYSSGCSCHGSCGVEHKPEYKALQVKGEDFDIVCRLRMTSIGSCG